MNKIREAKLYEIKFNRWELIFEYQEVGSLQELETLVSDDLGCLDHIRKTDKTVDCENIYNFVLNFKWFLLSSDHKTEPAGLWENDVHGLSYFEVMKSIYSKLYDSQPNI
mgnify:CR=1 FL=1